MDILIAIGLLWTATLVWWCVHDDGFSADDDVTGWG